MGYTTIRVVNRYYNQEHMKKIILAGLLMSSLCSGVDSNAVLTTISILGQKLRQAGRESPIALKLWILAILAQSACTGMKDFLPSNQNHQG